MDDKKNKRKENKSLIEYFLISIVLAVVIITAYRQGLTDARKIKENLPVTSFEFLKKEDKSEKNDDEFLRLLKSIDEYSVSFNEL